MSEEILYSGYIEKLNYANNLEASSMFNRFTAAEAKEKFLEFCKFNNHRFSEESVEDGALYAKAVPIEEPFYRNEGITMTAHPSSEKFELQ